MTKLNTQPHPCCVPSKERAFHLAASRQASVGRVRATGGSTDGMVRLPGGTFLMGTESDQGFPADGEGPIRAIMLDPFFLDTYPVTIEQFSEFARATGYKTEAERFGWSFVFHQQIPPEEYRRLKPNTVHGVGW